MHTSVFNQEKDDENTDEVSTQSWYSYASSLLSSASTSANAVASSASTVASSASAVASSASAVASSASASVTAMASRASGIVSSVGESYSEGGVNDFECLLTNRFSVCIMIPVSY